MARKRQRRRERRRKCTVKERKSDNNSYDVGEATLLSSSSSLSSPSSPASKLWSKVVSGKDKLIKAETENRALSEELPELVLSTGADDDLDLLPTFVDDVPRRQGIYVPPPLRHFKCEGVLHHILPKDGPAGGKQQDHALVAPGMTWNPWKSKDYLTEILNGLSHNCMKLINYPLCNTPACDQVREVTVLKPSPTISSVKLVVVPKEKFNFTLVPVQFTLKVVEVPPKCFPTIIVTEDMFDAVAVSPSGARRLSCSITGVETNSFRGYFTVSASGEVGVYKLKVTLQLMKNETCFQTGYEDVVSTTNVLVGRNYSRQRGMLPSNVVQLSVSEKDELGDDTLGTWGLSYDKLTDRIFYTDPGNRCVTCVDPTYSAKDRILFRLTRGNGKNNGTRFPMGISCDEYHRRLVVCDKGSNQIDFFSMDTGEHLSSWGGFGKRNGLLDSPSDVAVTRDGAEIVVSDSGNMKIQMFDRYGNFLRDRGCLPHPHGICFDSEKRILLTDADTKTVTEISFDCKSSRKLVLPGSSFFQSPEGLVEDVIGRVLVADSKNNCVRCLRGEDGVTMGVIHDFGDSALECPVNLTTLRGGFLAVLEKGGKLRVI